MIVAIDGPAGAGKSTVARALARELGFAYLDSGALYRCVALLALEQPQAEPARLAREAEIEMGAGAARAAGGPGAAGGRGAAVEGDAGKASADGCAAGDWGGTVLLDGREVTSAIRTPDVSAMASRVAADPGVRAALVAKQRALLARGDWVAEGRDIGTVVAPAAELKVFLTADAGERARRRALQIGGDPQTVLAEQQERDRRDATRAQSPLRAADDALELDTTGCEVGEVVRRISAIVDRAASSGSVQTVDL